MQMKFCIENRECVQTKNSWWMTRVYRFSVGIVPDSPSSLEVRLQGHLAHEKL